MNLQEAIVVIEAIAKLAPYATQRAKKNSDKLTIMCAVCI